MTYTAAQIIAKYIAFREHVQKRNDEFSAEMKPYSDAMAVLEASMSELLDKEDGKSIATEAGTAYRVTHMSTRVSAREPFMEFIFSDPANERFLTTHVAKDAVKEYLDGSGGAPPPGVDVTFIHKTQFRKA